ncbi:hypothetical protein MMC20_004617 [Loxospora ochrophaea]|nr:hypothetical protein [Loxospora ochrophaea]
MDLSQPGMDDLPLQDVEQDGEDLSQRGTEHFPWQGMEQFTLEDLYQEDDGEPLSQQEMVVLRHLPEFDMENYFTWMLRTPESTRFFDVASNNRFSFTRICADEHDYLRGCRPIFIHGLNVYPGLLGETLDIDPLSLARQMTPATLFRHTERWSILARQMLLIEMHPNSRVRVEGFFLRGLTREQRGRLQQRFAQPFRRNRKRVYVETSDTGRRMTYADVYIWTGTDEYLASIPTV